MAHAPVVSLMHLHSSLLLGRLAITFIVDYGMQMQASEPCEHKMNVSLSPSLPLFHEPSNHHRHHQPVSARALPDNLPNPTKVQQSYLFTFVSVRHTKCCNPSSTLFSKSETPLPTPKKGPASRTFHSTWDVYIIFSFPLPSPSLPFPPFFSFPFLPSESLPQYSSDVIPTQLSIVAYSHVQARVQV